MNALFWQIVFCSIGYWFAAPFAPLYLFAKLRGDSAARGLASNLALAILAGAILGPTSNGIKPVNLAIDAALLAVQVMICIRSQRAYPLFSAAAQLLIVQVELLVCAGFQPHRTTIEILSVVLATIQFAAFGLGLARHRSRRPLWQVRTRRENAPAELAPRANDAR